MPDTYHILTGYLPPELQGLSVLSSKQVKDNPFHIFLITEIYSAKIIDEWKRGSVYSSFGNSLGDAHPSLVKWSNYVWICLSNNVQNIKNRHNPSTIPPASGPLEDGYQWTLAFPVDLNRRISQYTRIPSFRALGQIVDHRSESFCNDSGVTGYCLIYKPNSTGTTGSLVNGSHQTGLLVTSCPDCQQLSSTLSTKYHTIFSESLPVTGSVSLSSITDKVNSAITDWRYSNNFEVQAAKTALESNLPEGAILGAFIDSSLLGMQIPTDTTIGISSGTGSSGDIRFVLSNIIGNTGEITGITLVNRGEAYSEILSATVTSSGLTAGVISQLQSAITLVCANNESQAIDGINNLFNIPEQFTGIVNLINYNLLAYNSDGITYNYYALITNSINNSLPVQVTGIQSIPNSEYNQSPNSNVSYAIQYVRPYL